MTKTARLITVTLTTLTVTSGLLFVGIWQFTRAIYRQRTCEWANIDNIELHTQIDIPAITTYDCTYDQQQNAKTARFDIDKKQVNMDRYIKINNFKKLPSVAAISLGEFFKKGLDTARLPVADLYYNRGSYHGESWQTLLDYATGQLWVTIHYKD